jgi:hypothetical protein
MSMKAEGAINNWQSSSGLASPPDSRFWSNCRWCRDRACVRHIETSGSDGCTAMHHSYCHPDFVPQHFLLVTQMEASLFIAIVDDRKNYTRVEYSSWKSPLIFLINSRSVYKTNRQNTCLGIYRYFQVQVNVRPTVSRPVCLGARNPSGTRDQFLFSPWNFF